MVWIKLYSLLCCLWTSSMQHGNSCQATAVSHIYLHPVEGIRGVATIIYELLTFDFDYFDIKDGGKPANICAPSCRNEYSFNKCLFTPDMWVSLGTWLIPLAYIYWLNKFKKICCFCLDIASGCQPQVITWLPVDLLLECRPNNAMY